MNKSDKNEYPLVYVVLPVHNRCALSLAFCKCLERQTYKNFRLVLVDDGSVDGTAAAVKEIFNDVIILSGNGNWWWAGSLQKAFDWFRHNLLVNHDFILIMNDDTSFDADFISIGMHILEENQNTLLTATGYNLKTGMPQDSGGYIMDWKRLTFSETYDNSKINCTSTRGLLMRVSDFFDTKGLYPMLLPHYLSDLEFTMRAQKKGKTLLINPNFRIGIDFETTGHRELGNETFLEYIEKVFSKRAAMNPIYWSNFILLHSDWKYKLQNLWRIWIAIYQQGIMERMIPEFKNKYRGFAKNIKERIKL